MGLDVYLYKFETPPVRGPEDDYDGGEAVELPSKVHPDHLFKVGYLRSSYNEGGINALLRKYTNGHTLHWIFGTDGNAYEFQPDWPEALKRCRLVQGELAAHRKESGGHTVTTLSFNSLLGIPSVKSEKQALDYYLKITSERKSRADDEDFAWFSNRDGEFFLGKRHLRVRAAFPGTKDSWRGGAEPCFYVVTEPDPDDAGVPDFYAQALEITAEMIEYVLGQPEPKKYWLHWSG